LLVEAGGNGEYFPFWNTIIGKFTSINKDLLAIFCAMYCKVLRER